MLRNRYAVLLCAILISMMLPGQFNVSAASNKTGASFVAPVHLAQDILDTETPTPAETETVTATETETPTAINTLASTDTETPTATETATETPTEINTLALTDTETPTATETKTPTTTATITSTLTPTITMTAIVSRRYVATGGINSGNCANSATPCATINYAIGQAASGNTIYVASGRYTGTGKEVALINKSVTLSGGWDASFARRNALSIIDGDATRRGVTVSGNSTTAVIDYFRIENSFGGYQGGGIYKMEGALTLNHSIVIANKSTTDGGGIFNRGTLTINNSTIAQNKLCCGGSYNGGGGIYNAGTLTINNSTIAKNSISGYYLGSAIFNDGSYAITTINNSTISSNTANTTNEVSAILNAYYSTLTINNSTIADNMGGIYAASRSVVLRNSILINNTISNLGQNCTHQIKSAGYNLIGSSCDIKTTTGDQVNAINPKLQPFQNSDGIIYLYGLMAGSPAINAGNPGTPGSGGNTCLATDQRGVVRSENGRCDIGAYEVNKPIVVSIKRLATNPTSALKVAFTVTFSKNVTGINKIAPFSDFTITKTGLTGITSIASVSGSGNIYTVTVNVGQGNGTIRLDVMDDDSIKDSSGNPLGGIGIGNGKYMAGQVYNILTVPIQLSPASNSISGPMPTYKWSIIPSATKYQYELMQGTKVIYTNTLNATDCKPTYCLTMPTNKLTNGLYKWRVRAMTGGIWKNFSTYKTLSVAPPQSGLWTGDSNFNVSVNGTTIYNYTMFVTVYTCGIKDQPLVFSASIPIVNNTYAKTGAAYFNGTFKTKTSADGYFGLSGYYYPGCGYISGGPFSTLHGWHASNQSLTLNSSIFTGPTLQVPYIFNLDPVQP